MPKPTRFSSIPMKDIQRLKDIWITLWKTSGEPIEGGLTEVWYHTVIQFLQERGDQLVPAELIATECSFLANDMAPEYLAALDETVQFDFEEVNDDKRTMELLHATVAERLAAVAKLRGGRS